MDLVGGATTTWAGVQRSTAIFGMLVDSVSGAGGTQFRPHYFAYCQVRILTWKTKKPALSSMAGFAISSPRSSDLCSNLNSHFFGGMDRPRFMASTNKLPYIPSPEKSSMTSDSCALSPPIPLA